MHILVVDDCQSIREGVCESVRRHGHLTAACEGAEVATQLLPYVDAVICDGLDFDCFAVVAHATRLGKPIVLYTASEEIAHAAEVAKVPCILKPAGVNDLMAALAQQEVAV
jgi:DNA-binding NtrC family response regulator